MIPKIIHQTWKNKNIPDMWKDYHKTWKKVFPESEYKHIMWTDEDNRNLIKNEYNWFLETYDNYPKNIQRADAIRYFILHHYGGIYADMDCEVRENFYNDLKQDDINIAESPYSSNGAMMNNFMASDKGNSKWEIVFKQLEKNKNILGVGESTGPGLINDCFQNKNMVNILDYKRFNPLKKRPFIRHLIEKNFTQLDDKKTKTWDSAKVVHHGTESWALEEIAYNYKHIFITVLVLLTALILFILYKKYKLKAKK